MAVNRRYYYVIVLLLVSVWTNAQLRYPTAGVPATVSASPQNLLLWSEDLTNAAWIKTNATIQADQATAPDATTTADQITTSATSHNVRQAVTVTENTQYTFSFYAKRGTMTDTKYSVFNATASSNIVAPTSYYSSISSGAFTRVSVTFTTPSGCTSINVYVIRDSQVTGTVFIWGAQLNTGSAAKTYTKTTNTNIP